ncbi:MFS transporter [Pandoraea sputorum]|uniref:Membrane protein n=1 Tax=Pandoraea sputorum TaxID=93222 RepID=A0A5E5BDW2_9BURK|nr:MFS transporter [Pandoraea sputorum]VVE84391.1 membrane protein [Pandoraea sputorum]
MTDLLPAHAPASWRTVLGTTIGNALEWYDFLIFGYLSPLLAPQFFPSDDPLTSMLLTTATFGVGFIVRPLAGIWMGQYADRRGRKAALSLIIAVMFVATAMLALGPTYEQAGRWAQVMLVTSRILQGISAGGEFGCATALLVELAPSDKKGLYGSWQMVAQSLGALMATLMAAGLTSGFSHQALTSGAWRLAFFVGLIIGPAGYWIRRNIPESAAFRRNTVKASILRHRRPTHAPAAIVICLALGGATSVMVYVATGYLPIFAVHTLHLPQTMPFLVLTLTLPVRVMLIPVFGHLADRIGRRIVLGTALVCFIALVYPAFLGLAHAPGMASLLAVQLLFAILTAAVMGPFAATAAELFPIDVRATGMSFTSNLSVALLGGFTPFLLTWLVAKTGDVMMPAHYMVVFLSMGALSLLGMPPTAPATLRCHRAGGR